MENKRYRVIKTSASGHCCFTHTVIDTSRPEIIGGEPYISSTSGKPHYESVCETFGQEQADLICKTLNKPNHKTQIDAYNDALNYAFDELELRDEAIWFLTLWLEGDWPQIKEEYPVFDLTNTLKAQEVSDA